MNELDEPDLDVIKQEDQACGRYGRLSACILRGVDERYNQRGRVAADFAAGAATARLPLQ